MMTMALELANQGHWDHGAWWPVFPFFWVLFWGLVIFALFRVRRSGRWHHHHSAEDVLAERYARGEINVDEYQERLNVLKKPGS